MTVTTMSLSAKMIDNTETVLSVLRFWNQRDKAPERNEISDLMTLVLDVRAQAKDIKQMVEEWRRIETCLVEKAAAPTQ